MSVPTAGAILAGKYVIHRRLGAGGYGAVYEGENIDLGKRVAIKLIAHRHLESEEALGRFRREARASAKIESANIVQVFDVGEDETFGLYMVMELLRGEDLRGKLDRAGKLAVEFAVDLTHQILCGLAKAHAVGVIHRDLKPANVFLHQPNARESSDDHEEDERVVVKIVDFGVAKLLDEALIGAVVQPLTTAGKTVGTPQYMAPEQVQGAPYDHRGDLWAVGALLYEMLSAHPAFALGDTFQETALSIVHGTPAPLTGVPPELVSVIDRALSKKRESRYADATSFADALMHAVPNAFIDERVAARVAEMVAVHPHRVASIPPLLAYNDAHLDGELADSVLPLERRRVGAIVALAVLALAAGILVLAAVRNPRPKAAIETAPAAAPSMAPSVEAIDSGAPGEAVDSALIDTRADADIDARADIDVKVDADIDVTTSAKPQTSVAKVPPKAPDQFGGTGVSSQF